MIITAVAAVDRRGLIGDGPRIPWRLPADLRRFRRLTLGKPVIMGRRTFDTLASPLPGRLNIVLSRTDSRPRQGCRIAGSIDEALAIARDHATAAGVDEVAIIGGGVIYEATYPLWDRVRLTIVEAEFAGDVFFPLGRILRDAWKTAEESFHPVDVENPYAHRFLTLEKPRPSLPDHFSGA